MFKIKTLLAASVSAVLLFSSLATAATIDAGLLIVGSIGGNAEAVNPGNTYTESLYSVVGGTSSAGSVANVTLTDTGDGWGHVASLTGDSQSTNTLYSTYDLSVDNTTVDTYSLTFGIDYYHSADADSGAFETGDLDARAISRLDVGIPFADGGTTVEYLDLELESESGDDYAITHPTWQDRVNTVYVGTNGADLEALATSYFTIELVAGASFNIEAEYLLSGRVFDDGASFDIDNSMFIFLDDFENLTSPTVPIPAAAYLFGSALGLLGWMRRKKA
jgi:hypothetical protein